MTERIPKLAVIVLMFCLTTSVFGLEIPLKYEKHPDDRSFHPSGSVELTTMTEPPVGHWKLPELKSKPPVYAFAALGDNQRLVVLDRQNAGDFFYNRIYFDSNENGDLTDDPVIDGNFTVEAPELCHAEFPPVDTMIEVGGKSLPYSFRAVALYSYYGDYGRPDKELSKEHIDQNLTLQLVVNCCYSGEFQLDGRTYRVALGDGNVNGRFDDKFSVREDEGTEASSLILSLGDDFYLTADRRPEERDKQTCGDLLLVNNGLFDVSISTAAKRLTLTPTGEKLLTLNVGMATEQMAIYTEDGRHCVMMYRPGKEVMIPEGKYRLLDYTALRKDEQGDKWLLQAAGTPAGPFVTVKEGSGSVLNIGEPYLPAVEVPEWSRQSLRDGDATEVQLLFAVVGSGKEALTELRRISGNRTRIPLSTSNQFRNRPKEPAYRIVKADGEVVTQGDFEYG